MQSLSIVTVYKLTQITTECNENPEKGFFYVYNGWVNANRFHFMRKLERQMNFAVSNKADWAGSNTQVNYNESTNCSQVYLHGHQIATFCHETRAIKLNSCGYETVTTKSRLNALLEEVKYGCRVFQKNFDWFVSYNDQTQDFIDGMILLDADSLVCA